MGKGTYPGPIQPLSAFIPGLDEKPGGLPVIGVQRMVQVPLVTLTAASITYKVGCWIAPSDGWWVVDAFFAEVVVPNYTGAVTLALENFDKSAAAGNNLLSAATIDLKALTAKTAVQLTLSATDLYRNLDEGDLIWATVAVGATQTTAGEGLVLVLVVQGPEIDPQ